MPKILINNSKKARPERTYVTKTCPVCGSLVEIFECEVKGTHVDKNGFISFDCPCGNKLQIKKYFYGKKYNENDYLKCTNYFYDKIGHMFSDDLYNIKIGYGKHYFNLNHVEMIVNPINVLFKIYVNYYEYENWENCLTENKLFKTCKFNLCELTDNLNNSAKYAQALMDYIFYLFSEYEPKLNIKCDSKDLISYFRNGDMTLNENDITVAINKRFELTAKKLREEKIIEDAKKRQEEEVVWYNQWKNSI